MHGHGVDIIAAPDETLERFVCVLLCVIRKGWIPRSASSKHFWVMWGLVAVAVDRCEVVSEHAKRASKWVARRSARVDEVFVTPSTDVRDLGQGGKESISVASVAEVHEAEGSPVGWKRRVRSVA